jgi:hypothetical protein
MARAGYVGSTATQGRDDITLNPAIYTPGGPTGNPQARRRFPEYGGINHFVQDRSSQYHSMQLSLNRRYANGFTARANYTLADLKGTIGGPEMAPYFHPDIDQIIDTYRYGRLDDMRRHRFVASWVYDVPGPASGVAAAVAGGWQITGIYQLETGEPFTIVSGRDNAGWGLGDNRAVKTGQPYDPPSDLTCASEPCVYLFNPKAFAVNPNGSFGETQRGEYFGPSESVLDLGIFKRFNMPNSMTLQFRAEIFNVLNTVNFDNPSTNAKTVTSTANFGRITGAHDPRIMQFGLKFGF